MSRELSEITRSLWFRGTRTLHWSSEPLSQEEPWARSWADIYVPEICEPMNTNWLVTMLPCHEPESMFLPYDSYLLLGTRATLHRPGLDPLPVADPGDTLRRDEWQTEDGYRVPVWSMEFLEEATRGWLRAESGYDFDLLFSEEAPSPIFREAEEALQRVQSGQEDTFDLGDGIVVSSGAMDELLRDPEMAGRVMRQLKRID